MKKLLVTIATLSVIITSSAEARSLELPLLTAKLTQFNVDPKLYYGSDKIESGHVVISKVNKTITLQLNRSYYCPYEVCPAVMPTPIVIQLPIKSLSTSRCGQVMYIASEDKRPVDGQLQTLTVVDNSNIHPRCATVPEIQPTEIQYETEGYSRMERFIKTHSTFAAEQLKPTWELVH